MPVIVPGSTSRYFRPAAQPTPTSRSSRIVAPSVVPTIVDAVSGIGDLVGRWRADQVTGLADGDAVASWPDASGYAYTATQGTSGNQPAWFGSVANGQPVVRFTAASNHGLVSSAPAGSPAQTVFAVIKVAAVGNYLTVRAGLASGALQFRVTPSGAPELVSQSTALIGTATTTIDATSFRTVTATFDQTADTYAFYVNGAAAGSGTTTQDLSANTTVIGTHPFAAAEAFDGDLAELIVFDRVLTSGELATVNTYLTDRYLPASTPGTASGSITLGGSASAQTPGTASGSVTLGGSVTAAAPAAAVGAITLGGTATARAASSATGSVTLGGTATAAAASSAAGSISMGGAVTAAAPASAAGSVALGGSAAARAAASASGSITLSGTAAGTGSGAASAAGSVTLSGAVTARAATSAAGGITLGGTSAPRVAVTAGGLIVLGGTATARVPATATGLITLSGIATGAAAAALARYSFWTGSVWQAVVPQVWTGRGWATPTVTVTPSGGAP